MSGPTVLLGTLDWRDANWAETLYPVDMPPEWRLAYFSTRFSCVWLPYQAWKDTAIAEAVAWLEDTHDSFRFLLEAGADAGVSGHERELLSILAPRLAAHCPVEHGDLLWFGMGVNLRDLACTLESRAASSRSTYLISRDGDLATLEKVGTLLGLLDLGQAGRVG